jgi:HemX protein
MKDSIFLLNICLPILYFVTFLVYLNGFIKGEKKSLNSESLMLFLILLLHAVYLILRTVYFDHPPITNTFEVFTILAFSVSFSYFILELLTNIKGTGLFIIFISLIFQIVSSFFIQDLTVVKPVLKSPFLGLHVFNALLGYSGITISAVYGFLYLILYKEIKNNKFGILFNRLPNLEVLEKMSFYSAIIGFILLTIAIVIGIIWLPNAFPNFSYADPQIVGTLLVWLIYCGGIVSKIVGKWRGKRVIILSIAGFLVAILTISITGFLSTSFHSFY